MSRYGAAIAANIGRAGLWRGAVAAGGGGGGGDAYADTVDGIIGPVTAPPSSHWRFGETGGVQFLDRKTAARHATVNGSVLFQQTGLPQNSDPAVDLAAMGYGEVPHDAGLALSAFSLSFWFLIRDYPSTEGNGREVLISKDQTGVFLGDFAVTVEDGGELIVQFQTASAEFQLPGFILGLNVPHHVVVRADGTGFDAYLDAQYLGKNTSHTDAWASNTQPLRFGAATWNVAEGSTWPNNPVLADAIIDEIALYPRVVTEAEVLALAQYNQAPIANPDTFVVPEEATRVLDVVGNDQYAGQKSALTVEVSPEPVTTWGASATTTHGTATVRGDKDIDFAAGTVTQNELDAFNARITDAFGTSGAALVNLTVQDATAPAEGDDGQGGTLIYSWAPLAVWIDDVPLAERDTGNVDGIGGGTGPGTLSWWQDGANPANGGGRVGHTAIKTVNWIGVHNVCWNRAPTGHPALEMYNPTSLNSPATFDLYPFHVKGALPTNPRHVRMVVEYMHCVPSHPTTYKGQGLGSQSGSYPDFRDSFQNPNHSGKYMSGLTAGRFGRGSCSTNWYAKSNYPRDVAYFATAFKSSADVRSYSYFYSRDTDCGGFNGYNGIANFIRPELDGKWNRWEFEMKLQDPALVNSSWGGTSFPTGGDGFIRQFFTSDLDGTPSARTQFIDHQGLVIFGSQDNNHVRCAINGPFIYQYHGGVATPNINTWGWVRLIQCYHYPADDI